MFHVYSDIYRKGCKGSLPTISSRQVSLFFCDHLFTSPIVLTLFKALPSQLLAHFSGCQCIINSHAFSHQVVIMIMVILSKSQCPFNRGYLPGVLWAVIGQTCILEPLRNWKIFSPLCSRYYDCSKMHF